VYSLNTLERTHIEIAFRDIDDVLFVVKKISVRRTCSFPNQNYTCLNYYYCMTAAYIITPVMQSLNVYYLCGFNFYRFSILRSNII